MAFTVSGIVAVGGESEEGGGSSACLSRPDSDGCGDFTGLFLDLCEKARARGKSMCVRPPAKVLYSDCSPQFKSIYSPANSRESKQTHCLIGFGSLRVFAQGRFIFMSFSLIVEKPEEIEAEVLAFAYRGNDSVRIR